MAKQVKRTRRTPEQMAEARANESQGLGDTVEKIFEATGIAKLVHFIAGDDCNCDKRKATLNKLFPYNNPLCLTEDEYQYLDAYIVSRRDDLKHAEQTRMLSIYNRVFKAKNEPSNCASCWRDIMNSLKKVHATYEETI
jgi:hypothetical protein